MMIRLLEYLKSLQKKRIVPKWIQTRSEEALESSNYFLDLLGWYLKMATKKGGAKGKKFELTEEQKQEIREAFDLFDTDGSGI